MTNQCRTKKLARKRSLAVVATLALLLFQGGKGVPPTVSAGGLGVLDTSSHRSRACTAPPTVSAGGSGDLLLSPSGFPAPQTEDYTAQLEASQQFALTPEGIVVANRRTGVFLTGGCSASASGIPLPVSLCNRRVEVQDSIFQTRIAPLFSICPDRVVYQMPAGTLGGTVTTRVRDLTTGMIITQFSNTVQSVAPGIYTLNTIGDSPCRVSTGQGIAKGQLLRVDKSTGAQTYENLSATGNFLFFNTFDYYLVLYGTGFRRRNSPLNASLTIGGINVGVTYAGAQGTQVGLDQINSGLLPSSLNQIGTRDVVFIVDNNAANIVQVNFR